MASFRVTCSTLGGSSHAMEVRPETPIEELRARCTAALAAVPEVRLLLGTAELGGGGTCSEAGLAQGSEVTLVVCEPWAIDALRTCSECRCWERPGSKEKDRALAALVLLGGMRDIPERHSRALLDIISADGRWNGTPVVIRIAQVFACSCKAHVFAPELVRKLSLRGAPSYLAEASLTIALAEIVRRDKSVLSSEPLAEVLKSRFERFKLWVQMLGTFNNPVIIDAVIGICRLAREVGDNEILEEFRARLGERRPAESWREDAFKILTSIDPSVEPTAAFHEADTGGAWLHILHHGTDPTARPMQDDAPNADIPAHCGDLMGILLQALAHRELITRGQPTLVEPHLQKHRAARVALQAV